MAVGAFFQRLKQGLTKSRETWVQKIGTIFQNRQWDEKSLEEMEESLLTADVGVKATDKLMQALRRISPADSEDLSQDMSATLQAAMVEMLRGSVTAPKRAPLSVAPLGNHLSWGQRRRQDYHHWQACCPVPQRG